MRRVSPATVISCVALFFSIGGVGLAAQHYRITSLHQIKPSVRHQLMRARTTIVSPSVVQLSDDPAKVTTAIATCPRGDYAISGGFTVLRGVVVSSTLLANGWEVQARFDPAASSSPPEDGVVPTTVTPGVAPWALCVRATRSGWSLAQR